jgi:hypothetical protein
MDKSKTPRHKVRYRHDPKRLGGVLDSSIVQGPVSVAPCQTRISDSRLFHSPYVTGARARVAAVEVRRVAAVRLGPREALPLLQLRVEAGAPEAQQAPRVVEHDVALAVDARPRHRLAQPQRLDRLAACSRDIPGLKR